MSTTRRKRAADTTDTNAADGSAAKRQKIDYTQILTVRVGKGDDRRDFYIHLDVATRSSKVLKQAIDPEWSHRQQKCIELPLLHPVAFEQYVNWLYGETLPVSSCNGVIFRYALGQQLQDNSFSNAQIDSLFRPSSSLLTFGTSCCMVRLWKVTPPGCKLRTLFLRHLGATGSHRDLHRLVDMPANFWQDLCREMLPVQPGDRPLVAPTFANRCDFHEHEEGEPRCI